MDLTMGGQFALIPAKVLYDDKLPATAKLLYGEIYRLSYANGYCYATNKDFERLLQRSSSTVSDLLKDLVDGGYIRVKQIRRNGTSGDIIQRRIFCGQTLAPEDPADDSEGIPENRDTSPGKPGEGIPENREDTLLIDNNNIPPIVPQGVRAKKCARTHKETADWKPDRFEAFWLFYRTNARGENRQRAIRAWDKLQPSDELIAKIGRSLQWQVKSEDWIKGIGIPHASTYLNNARWEDTPPRPRAAAQDRPVMEEQEGVTYF